MTQEAAPEKQTDKKKAPPNKETSKVVGGSPPPFAKPNEEETPKLARLTAAAILAVRDIREEEIEIKEWGGTVVVRGLKSIDHERLTSSCTEGPVGERQFNMVGYQAKVAILCSYDGFEKDGGKRIFKKDQAHLSMLMEKASGPVADIATKAHELSGIGKDAADRMKENLSKTPSADSLFG